MRLLRALTERVADYPRVVFVHQGDLEQGAAFFERFWPEASAIADPDHQLYDAFEVGRGSLRAVLGPRALAGGVRAMLGGNGVGKPVGDVWRMPGAFLLYEGAILWSHPFRHAGDLPDYERITALLGALRQAGRIPERSAPANAAPLS